MPRETIFTPHPTDPAEPGFRPFQMQVGWNKDQDVQVGIVTHDDRHLVDYIYAGEEEKIGRTVWDGLRSEGLALSVFESSDSEADFMRVLGRTILDAVTASTPFGTSVWWHPGRAQINDLIRKLRRARDSAYGADA